MDVFRRSSTAPPVPRNSLANLLTHSFAILAGLLVVALVGAVTTFVIILGGTNPQITRGTDAVTAINRAQEGMLDQETGLRGFLLTGDRNYLGPYVQGQQELKAGNDAIVRAIRGDAGLVAAFTTDRAAQDSWIRQWAVPALNPALHAPGVGGNRQFLDQGRALFDTYRSAESAFTVSASALIVSAQATEETVLRFGGLAAVCIFIAIVVVGMREYNRIQDAVVEPVEHLLAGMAEIRDGHLDVRLLAEGPSELRDLGTGLAEMAASLAREQSMVAARERELSWQTTQLRMAQIEAEHASEAKSEFLSRMSHELRTPLTAVIGFGELLDLEKLTPTQREFVDAIIKAGNHLLELVNEVLDITKIEAGQLDVTFEPIDIAPMFGDVLNLVRPLTAARSISLATASICDVQMIADRQRLKQVILNLVANAVKYNEPHGTVTVGAECTDDQTVRLTVSDTGPGISDENLAKLFSPFERLDASGTGAEGTGLGLALSRSLTDAMGARIGADSTVGAGSTFWVDVQANTGSRITATRTGTETAGNPPNQFRYGQVKRVLYVEDTLSNVRLVENILARRPDIELLTAMQGSIALDIAREHVPDLILLDLHLPDMGGDVVLEQLKADDRTRDIPVIVLSADATVRQIDRLMAVGATAYITKPITMRSLLAKLDVLLAAPDDRRSNAISHS